MTAVLLDTHAYVWAATDGERLSTAARELIVDPSTTLAVSVATTWEMSIKHRAGKWPEAEPLLQSQGQLLTRLRADSLPIDADDAIRAGGMAWSHQDPFDRMIAAQAMRRGLTLISRDPVFRELPGLLLVW